MLIHRTIMLTYHQTIVLILETIVLNHQTISVDTRNHCVKLNISKHCIDQPRIVLINQRALFKTQNRMCINVENMRLSTEILC